MGIYIPGIDMPDSCDNCFICNRCEGNCDISDADYLPDKRPNDCPLIELPPHGRLGDLDALIDVIERIDWYHQNEEKDMVHGANSEEHQAWYKEQDIYEAIENAETIIPAEGGANDG